MIWVTPITGSPLLLIPESWSQWTLNGAQFRRMGDRIEQYDGWEWWPLATEPYSYSIEAAKVLTDLSLRTGRKMVDSRSRESDRAWTPCRLPGQSPVRGGQHG